ncbi:MAG TPA: hypothetical protein VHL98_14835 [Microvirga sp.]|nr:hypothetical protein [Microvirga sp.]
MIFREGLLEARGQIVFILALAISTGVIIYLEALDTEERIRGRIDAALVGSRPAPAAVPEPVADRARAALRRAEEAYTAAPAAPEARAALLTALAGAVQLGVVAAGETRPRVETVLAAIESDRAAPPTGLAAALGVVAAAFPDLQERIGRLPGS